MNDERENTVHESDIQRAGMCQGRRSFLLLTICPLFFGISPHLRGPLIHLLPISTVSAQTGYAALARYAYTFLKMRICAVKLLHC